MKLEAVASGEDLKQQLFVLCRRNVSLRSDNAFQQSTTFDSQMVKRLYILEFDIKNEIKLHKKENSTSQKEKTNKKHAKNKTFLQKGMVIMKKMVYNNEKG